MRRSAFTIVEIMVILMIIGILMGLSVGGAVKVLEESRLTQAQADVAALEAAVSRYERDRGVYPPALTPAHLADYIDFDSGRTTAGGYQNPWGINYSYSIGGTHNPEFVEIWTTRDSKTIGNW